MGEYITINGRMEDITGQRFGRLVALGPVGRDARGNVMWRCQCDCGKEIVGGVSNLRSGNTKSCGCFRRDKSREIFTKHGLANDRLYRVWANIKNRCHNPATPDFSYYGERGISICGEWRDDFQAFYEYVTTLPGFKKSGMTLDRINNDGNYEPGNVRWATRKEQVHNRRERKDSAMIEFHGKTQCLSAWARELGLPQPTLWARINSGWPIERALTKGR